MPNEPAKTFFIKPKPDLRIADPQTGVYLPPEGALMPRAGFWLRRLWDGDVIECRDRACPVSTEKPARKEAKS